jgi:radical SAM protein with 4Fe4S-binding SPASM domain
MTAAVPPDLSWVDEFVTRIRPYVFVRATDNVLIKRPNVAQKLNPQGVALLKALLDGQRIDDVLAAVGRDPAKAQAIGRFVLAVKQFLEGTLDETTRSPAVEVRPFELPFAALPILSEVAVTYRCNLRCTFCYAGCNCTRSPAGDGREMSTAQIKDVLRMIYQEAEAPSVSFTGGEPTLRRDLPELVAHARALGMRVNLITNGTCIGEALARRLASAGLDSAQVSLEGISTEVHERITLVPGSFRRSVAAVHHLAAAGVRVHTNTTINRDNLAECVRMPAFVKTELGAARFSMNLMIPAGSGEVNRRLAVRYGEIGPHLRAIAAESRRHGVEFMWYSPTPMCLFNPVAHGLGNKGCSACDGLLSVAPNGDVLPCASYAEPVGNLLEQRVRDVWASRRATQFRDKFLAHPACRACADFAACNGACPLYWRQMGFDELNGRQGFAPVPAEHFAQ